MLKLLNHFLIYLILKSEIFDTKHKLLYKFYDKNALKLLEQKDHTFFERKKNKVILPVAAVNRFEKEYYE